MAVKAGFQRLRLRLEFDGAPFLGWQRQGEDPDIHGRLSLQKILEDSIARVLRRPQERFIVQGCGRTDAGVHAEEFFAHVDVPADAIGDEEKLRHSVNSVLPDGVAITALDKAPAGFHAIDNVVGKVYEYRLLVRRARPTFQRPYVLFLPVKDEDFKKDLLRAALKKIEGEHDFKAFCAAGASTVTTVRRLDRCELIEEAVGHDASSGKIYRLRFEGRGFLRHMVRNLTGTLVEISTGKRPLSSLDDLLNSAPRTEAGECAPPHGLVLKRVIYGQEGACAGESSPNDGDD